MEGSRTCIEQKLLNSEVDFKEVEELKQLNHELQKKLNVKINMENEMKEEIHLLENLLKNQKLQMEQKDDESKLLKAQILKLENSFEEEKMKFEAYKEINSNENQTATAPSVSNHDSSMLKHFEESFENQKIELEKLALSSQMHKELANDLKLENIQMEAKIKYLQSVLEEKDKMIEYKTETLNEIKEDRESLREKAALLESELMTLKSAPSDLASKGNSLFAEVEDNRKLLVAKLKETQMKYAMLKKKFQSMNNEVSRLREQHVLVYREWHEIKDEKWKSDSRLLTAHLARIVDLERELKHVKEEQSRELKQAKDANQDGNLMWVDELIESKRKEADDLRKELQSRALTEWSLQQNMHQLKSELLYLRKKLLKQTVGDLDNSEMLEKDVSPTSVLKENIQK